MQKQLDNSRIKHFTETQATVMKELEMTRQKLQHESKIAQQMLVYADEHRATWKVEKGAIAEEVRLCVSIYFLTLLLFLSS